MKTMSDDICMIKEQFPENMFSEAASKLKSALKSTKKSAKKIREKSLFTKKIL